jgi:hypothetical protein
MKKFSLFLVTCLFALTSFGQTVITNNYDNPIQSANGNNTQTSNSDDAVETVGAIGVYYWAYDKSAYGLGDRFLSYNGFGFIFNMRYMSLGDIGNDSYYAYNIDLCPAYSFGLLNKNDSRLYLTLAAGPSIANRDVYNMDKDKKESKWFCDGYIEMSATYKYKKIMLTAGYSIMGAKFKFDKESKFDGVFFGIGYCL